MPRFRHSSSKSARISGRSSLNSICGLRQRLAAAFGGALIDGECHQCRLLAPNAKLRCEIIPSPPEHRTEHSTDHAHAQGASARMNWARLLKRVFDIEHCPNCGGALKIIAAPSTGSGQASKIRQ